MKCESTTKQPQLLLEPLEHGRVRVTLYANETPVEREDGTHYQYDQYTMEVTDRPGLRELIEGALEDWIEACAQTERNEAAAEARAIRDRLLAESDARLALDRLGLELPDKITATSLLTAFKALIDGLRGALSGEWAAYRQALRDLPEQPGFPFEIHWPVKPE